MKIQEIYIRRCFDCRCYSTYPQITYWQEGFAEASII